jgi:hypothetical protein
MLTAVLISASVLAADHDVVIKSGFLTGNQYRAMTDDARRKYAMGIVDGIFLSPFFGAKKENLSRLERCLSGMQDTQLVAILDKDLAEHPTRWHEPMNTLSYFAFIYACGK